MRHCLQHMLRRQPFCCRLIRLGLQAARKAGSPSRGVHVYLSFNAHLISGICAAVLRQSSMQGTPRGCALYCHLVLVWRKDSPGIPKQHRMNLIYNLAYGCLPKCRQWVHSQWGRAQLLHQGACRACRSAGLSEMRKQSQPSACKEQLRRHCGQQSEAGRTPRGFCQCPAAQGQCSA